MRSRNPYQQLVDWFAGTRQGAWIAKRAATWLDRRLFKLTRGRLTSGIGTDYGERIGLLTTTGAKSGQPREVPLLTTVDGDAYLVVGSNGGDESEPAWVRNVRANPMCTLTLRGAVSRRRAVIAEGAERERLLEVAIAQYGGYATYRDRLQSRSLPVVRLEPVD